MHARFLRKFCIKSIIGAIGCTHIAIIAPPSKNVKRPLNVYSNRKGFYSINVEAESFVVYMWPMYFMNVSVLRCAITDYVSHLRYIA